MSTTLDLKSSGFGIELEGFIVDRFGTPLPLINGESSYLALKNALNNPEWLSAELLSCQAEVKTAQVHTSCESALVEIKRHMDTVNSALNLLLPGCYLDTSATINMAGVDLVAADPSASSYNRVLQWSQTRSGREILRSTATCSMQLCVSNHHKDMDYAARWLWLQQAYAYLHANAEQILSINHTDRFKVGEELIQSVKLESFRDMQLLEAYDREWITRPCGRDLDKWYMAHSGVRDIRLMNSKDAHSILAKGKLIPGTKDLICIEYRFKDAEKNLDHCLRRIMDIHDNILCCS